MSSLSCGIIGLPNVGKSTMFNAITELQVEASNYPFCTIEPNTGIADIVDPRLMVLSDMSGSRRIIYATLEIRDIAGLVAGASKGEGLGNQFLNHIRQTNAILHVVRCFESENIVHVTGSIDPVRDIEVINLELILADLQMVENTLAKIQKQAKNNKEAAALADCLGRVRDHLNANKPVISIFLNEEEVALLQPYAFLTSKKVLYVANVENPEDTDNNPYLKKVQEYATKEGNHVLTISAKLEEEIAQLPSEERQEFLSSLGMAESGLNRLVKEAFNMLGMINFFTTGEQETRAWPIREGTTAVEAAGKIHTDIQKGFIRAEVVSYADTVAYKGRQGAKEAGKLRAEGRNYVMQDGDVVHFLHN